MNFHIVKHSFHIQIPLSTSSAVLVGVLVPIRRGRLRGPSQGVILEAGAGSVGVGLIRQKAILSPVLVGHQGPASHRHLRHVPKGIIGQVIHLALPAGAPGDLRQKGLRVIIAHRPQIPAIDAGALRPSCPLRPVILPFLFFDQFCQFLQLFLSHPFYLHF